MTREQAEKTPMPADEAGRQAAVNRYDVLDTPEDGAFDRITALAARHFGVPISIVSIVDHDRIWFKSHHGLEVQEIDRDPGLCASAIMQYEPWILEDAAADPRSLANPLVAGEFGLRFYAGAPLTTRDGYNLGTLCIIGQEPRTLSAEEAETLQDMAAIVMDELELRLASRQVVDQEHSLRDQAEQMARALQESLLPPRLPSVPDAELAPLYRPASRGEVGGDFYDVFEIDGGWVLVIGDVSGKGATAAAVTALARHSIRTGFLAMPEPTDVLAMLNRAMFVGLEGAAPRNFCTVLVATLVADSAGFEVTVAGAGHPPALLLRADGATEALSGAGGPPVGWHSDARFEAQTTHLGSGDALVMYTDGLTEARRDGELLGEEGVLAALEPGRPAGAAQLVERLTRALEGAAVEVRDDVAVLVMRVCAGGAA